jgi:hypothetical protein
MVSLLASLPLLAVPSSHTPRDWRRPSTELVVPRTVHFILFVVYYLSMLFYARQHPMLK